MNKLIISLALLFSFTCVHAGATGGFTSQDTSIITPDVAIGMRRFDNFTHDTNGFMVVCTVDDYSRGGWKPLSVYIPRGRTYVGFKIVSRDYGYRQLELYWK